MVTFSRVLFAQDYDPAVVKKDGITAIKHYSCLPNKKRELVEAYYFDLKGNLVERYERAWTTPRIRYAYDDANNLVSKELFDTKGGLNEYHHWTYDRNGKIETHTSKYSFDKTPDTYYFFYNKSDQLIQMIEKNANGDTTKKMDFVYTMNGFISHKRFQNFETKVDRIDSFEDCSILIFDPLNNSMFSYYVKQLDSCKNNLKKKYIQSKAIDTTDSNYIITTTVYPQKKFVTTKTPNGKLFSIENYFYLVGNELERSVLVFYNEQGQIIEEKNFYSGKSMSECGEGDSAADEYFHFKTEYFPNGLKKRVNSYDKNGKLSQYSEYEMEY